MLRTLLAKLSRDLIVSIAGAILWGVLPSEPPTTPEPQPGFNRRGDSLGGAAPEGMGVIQITMVSIAGAILWGVLQEDVAGCRCRSNGFNRRGDSLGGAAGTTPLVATLMGLFQSQGRFFGGCCPYGPPIINHRYVCFNRRGDSLGGAALCNRPGPRYPGLFQSQGRFFGGCCIDDFVDQLYSFEVSIAGAILWGVLRGNADALL